jgi:hypothetical protein
MVPHYFWQLDFTVVWNNFLYYFIILSQKWWEKDAFGNLGIIFAKSIE